MSELNKYLDQCDSNQKAFDEEYQADMDRLDEYINDAFEHLEQAQSLLFFKHDTFSSAMNKAEFDELIIEKLKELL